MQKSIQEVSSETLTLENYFNSMPLGAFISYLQLEKSTGIKMDIRGKSFIKSAMNRLKLEYEIMRGMGLRIVCKDNAITIVGNRVVKMHNATRRAYKVTKRVKAKVFNELPDEEQKKISKTEAALGTILSFNTGAKRIFVKDQLKIGQEIVK